MSTTKISEFIKPLLFFIVIAGLMYLMFFEIDQSKQAKNHTNSTFDTSTWEKSLPNTPAGQIPDSVDTSEMIDQISPIFIFSSASEIKINHEPLNVVELEPDMEPPMIIIDSTSPPTPIGRIVNDFGDTIYLTPIDSFYYERGNFIHDTINYLPLYDTLFFKPMPCDTMFNYPTLQWDIDSTIQTIPHYRFSEPIMMLCAN